MKDGMADLALPTVSWRQWRLASAARTWRPWCSKAFFAIVDQGLISGSNFALGILLARWLGAEEYGAYALAFAIFVLLSLVYQSVLLEPMSVFGPSAYRNQLRGYTGTLIWIHVAIAFATFLLLGVGALGLAHFPRFGGLSPALVGASIAAPCVLLFWLARRVYYLKLASSQSAVGALLYSVLLFGSLAVLHHRNMMSPMLAFVIMAIAALIASGYLLVKFKPKFSLRRSHPSLAQVSRENWEYGRWALASAIFMWVPWNIFYTLVASFSGMAHSGSLRALLNFALPLAQAYGAFSLLFLPHAAGLNEDKGWDAVRRDSHRITLLFLAGGVVYWVLICSFRSQLIQLLYRGQYASIQPLLPWIGLASILWGAAQGPALALRARKTPSSVFVMYLVSAIVAVVVGVPATLKFGVAGAVAAMLLASGAAWITGIIRIAKPMPAQELRQVA
jgi:O-antigen/teichoic acid export membrane protein